MAGYWAIGVGTFSALLYYYDSLEPFATVVGYTSVVLLGAIVGFSFSVFRGRKHTIERFDDLTDNDVLMELLNLSPLRSGGTPSSASGRRQHVTFTKNIDAAIDEVIDLTIRDYVVSWLQGLVRDQSTIIDSLKEDFWFAIVNLKDRLSKIDEVKFIANDVTWKLCQHYQKISRASVNNNGRERKSPFMLHPYLATEESEMEFLRKFAELIVLLLAPRTYAQSVPVRHLLREILVSSVLYPTVNMLCDPDYINQKLLDYLLYHEELMEQHKKTYTYAATYEGFVKLIHECTNIEQLKHVRYNIMTEIMQATTINNLKKSKGIDVEKEFISQGTAKGDLLQARNLKRYINQLTFAKALCEKRLKILGGPDYSTEYGSSSAASTLAEEQQNVRENKVLSHSTIMQSDFARSFFLKFLANEDVQFLLEFYVSVEEMKECEKNKIHQLASEIFKAYIAQVSSTLKLDRSILKGMESFMIGNKGPESFVEAQEGVYEFLEERYYPSFIVSKIYNKMMSDAERVGIEFDKPLCDDDKVDGIDGSELTAGLSAAGSIGIPLSDHSSYAKDKVERLDEKINNKLQALSAMKNSPLCEGAKVIVMLEKEIETMKVERRLLTLHIERTETWAEKLGHWRALVHSIEMVEEKDRMVPLFLLVVHLNCDSSTTNDGEEEEEEELHIKSWVVKRRIADFNDLSQRLAQMASWVKNIELPKENKIRNRGTDKLSFEKTISMLQRFIDAVLNDDTMCSCEAVYAFLSPSPEHLKQCLPSPKKSKFFFSTFFKSTQSSGSQGDGSDDEDFLFLDDIDSSLKDDRIAEPLYALVGEIFDMRGVFMLLRRTLISFVQITFGRTINRQLRDTMSWLFSESMVVYYLHLFRDSMWPNGKIYTPMKARSDEEKLETRCRAKQQFLSSIPDILSNLVGQQNAKKGTRKVFESLQDVRLNKQLFYELLEMLIIELFPEIKA